MFMFLIKSLHNGTDVGWVLAKNICGVLIISIKIGSFKQETRSTTNDEIIALFYVFKLAKTFGRKIASRNLCENNY